MRLLGYSFLLITAFITACNFTPTGENFVELTPVTSGIFYLSVDNDGDTIELGKSKDIKLQVDVEDRKVYLIQVYVDDSLIKELTPPNFELSLYGAAFGSGYHKMEFVVISNTGSGSLADATGQELLGATFSITLYIDIRPPNEVKITNFENVDGSLKITWEKYKRVNFVRYLVYRSRANEQNSYNYMLIASIDDQDVNYVYDDSYLGTELRYWIVVEAFTANYDNQLSQGIDSIIELNPTKIQDVIITHPMSDITVEWDTCNYNKSFYRYNLIANYTGLNANGEAFFPIKNGIEDINITSTTFGGLPLGNYNIVLNVANTNTESFSTYDTMSVAVGQKSFRYNSLKYDPSSKLYYRIFEDTITAFNKSQTVERVIENADELYFNEYFPRGNKVYLPIGKQIHILSSSDLNTLEVINLEDFIGGFDELKYFSCTNDGKMAIYNVNRDPSSKTLTIIDLNLKEIIYEKDWYGRENGYALSLDGKFFCIDNSIYRWNGSEFVEYRKNFISRDDIYESSMVYVITSDYQIVTYEQSQGTPKENLIQYDILSGKIVSEIPYEGSKWLFEFDELNNIVYSQTTTNPRHADLYMIKINKDRELEPVTLKRLEWQVYSYLNDTLYCSNGFKQHFIF